MGKRSRDDEASVAYTRNTPPALLTPHRSVALAAAAAEGANIPNLLLAPICSRSPSPGSHAGTEGLSDDSVFLLELSCGSKEPTPMRQQPHGNGSGGEGVDADALQWQRDLNLFFAQLDERPLHVA